MQLISVVKSTPRPCSWKHFGLVVLAAWILFFLAMPVHAEPSYQVGTLLPLTGSGGPQGAEQQRGNILAARHVNRAGGIRGVKLKLIHRDSGTDPTVAVDAARKLVQVDGVPAIVGAWSSGVSKAVAQAVTIPNRVVQIMQGSTSPMLSILRDQDYVFRACMHDLYQGGALGKIIRDDDHQTLSILYVNNPYGKGMADATTVRFEQLGGKVLRKVPYEIGKASYSAEVSRTFQGNPDAVLMVTYPEDAIVIFKQAIQNGNGPSSVPWYGTDAWKVPDVVNAVGAEHLEGVKGTSQGIIKNPSYETFTRAFKEEFGHAVQQPFTETGYDATASIALAIARSGKSPQEIKGKHIRDSLRQVTSPPGQKIYAGVEQFKKAFRLLRQGKEIDYEGVAGKVAYDRFGDAKSAVQTWVIRDGIFEVEDNFIPKPVSRDKMGPSYQR